MGYEPIGAGDPPPDRPFAFDAAPDEMLVERRWVGWRLEPQPGKPKPTKVPYRADGRKAASTRPDDWCSWREAVAAVSAHRLTGIGFVLGGGWVGVDVDHAVSGGVLSPLAAEVVADLGGYAELSPSQTGVHVIVRGEMPGKTGRKRGQVEMYAGGRFFTFTGWWLGGDRPGDDGFRPAPPAPSRPTVEGLKAFYDRHFPADEPLSRASTGHEGRGLGAFGFRPPADDRPPTGGEFDPTTLTDEELVRRIAASKQGAKFEALFNGRWQGYFGSQSEADASLVSLLKWWCRGDEQRVDRLFQMSRLMRPKWLERRGAETYGQRTIRKIG